MLLNKIYLKLMKILVFFSLSFLIVSSCSKDNATTSGEWSNWTIDSVYYNSRRSDQLYFVTEWDYQDNDLSSSGTNDLGNDVCNISFIFKQRPRINGVYRVLNQGFGSVMQDGKVRIYSISGEFEYASIDTNQTINVALQNGGLVLTFRDILMSKDYLGVSIDTVKLTGTLIERE